MKEYLQTRENSEEVKSLRAYPENLNRKNNPSKCRLSTSSNPPKAYGFPG
jgi:hypothetical protein